MKTYFSVISRKDGILDFTPPLELSSGVSISRHYDNLKLSLGDTFVDIVYRQSQAEALSAAKKLISEQPNPF